MSKPWNVLREPPKPAMPNMREGSWRLPGGSVVSWSHYHYPGLPSVRLEIDGHRMTSQPGLSVRGARLLAEFLIELADQLEAQ